ncbi:S66 peptidase family protein [Cytobacillus oceanisediminis]|uniref:LD-carboxypeptidase n=1 Tax=Cytobacillus oceanisediminis 2691 TaxID=1196031 RepID=A0A160M7C4_9BACI|nr:LD-carboxypeptidase [Cytobacillus oceanisediminis]MCS0826912.1 LD-carboxypeptidase [Cytobacillus firmus]AND37838.1 LD-carboxypeptidase [Cytobacillus oceanisediminis 2691]MBU8732592.1 LD-carboxypeptidase [Cytobacillus oceanisediminis]MBU8772801.1 LD-carboxypeptidase [Cytobacillus oceanisediminis]MCM3245964.1 LD-carboxypeptidase [Cytobacillus oceanisediminis]
MAMKPQRLEKGDAIGIIAPASPPNQENLKRSLAFLDELGVKVKMGDHVTDQYGYLAGNDEDRLADLHKMFLDKEVKAIICAGGGYGTGRIASQIDYSLIKENPKIFWGYSDITFLHTAIRQQTGLVTFHGPMLASDIGKEDADPLSKQYFNQLFEPVTLDYPEGISNLETMVSGRASGVLTGGNLSLLASTIGTPYEIDTKDKLVLIEDINEEPRAVDRMLNQLHMAGKLEDAAGFIIGDFNNCVPERELSLELDEVLDTYIKRVNKPAVKGFNIGHCSPHISVPLGVMAELDAAGKKLIIESGVK